MNANNLYLMGIGGCALAGVNAMLWFGQWMSERRYQFISADTRKWCLHRMWLNIAIAAVFAIVGIAGWWWA